ncbi:MAG: 2-dehydropantoate 2-reductase, partial [Flavobacteriales bacterium]|nr:2-dehydropantoate 2-reductase [Flavobacteriales bacterium]
MKIAIIGSGGVGGYFGAKLARAGNRVTFIARGEHLRQLKANGIKVKSINGNFSINTITATDEISELKSQDLILVTTKAWQVKEVAKQISKIVGETTVVIPLQNGVMATDELADNIPLGDIITGSCQIISKIEVPGIINHFGIDPLITIGEKQGSISPRLENIKRVFDEAQINTRLSKDINADLWKKFIFICVGGLITICRSTYGEVRSVPESRQLIRDVLSEGYAVSQAADINIDANIIEKMMTNIDNLPYNSTSSLCRDVWEGK